jgi:hypothetical protein
LGRTPTAYGDWTVKNVAAHLQGGNLGRLWSRKESTRSTTDLVQLIDRSNAEWVQTARRISPEILVEFLELTDARLYQHFKSLPSDQPAGITVAWASDDLPPNWFDIAREYTEKWLHQPYIREAVGQPLLDGREWLYPVLDTFLRGLPRTYRSVKASQGISITVQIILGEACGEWSLIRLEGNWGLFSGSIPQPACRVRIGQDLAWRLFTKAISPENAQNQVMIEGDLTLGSVAL